MQKLNIDRIFFNTTFTLKIMRIQNNNYSNSLYSNKVHKICNFNYISIKIVRMDDWILLSEDELICTIVS